MTVMNIPMPNNKHDKWKLGQITMQPWFTNDAVLLLNSMQRDGYERVREYKP